MKKLNFIIFLNTCLENTCVGVCRCRLQSVRKMHFEKIVFEMTVPINIWGRKFHFSFFHMKVQQQQPQNNYSPLKRSPPWFSSVYAAA